MSKQTKVKYYTPKTKVEKKVITDTRDVPKKMAAKADKNGIIQVQLHREAAIEKLSTNIYTDPKAGIREYINNEARPCREAIKLGHNASIHITVKGNDRTIIIEGIGSMGMTMDMFTEVYTILGLSGNLDEHESGQFGFGRASYLCLSDTMVLETYSRETGERFGFIGRNGTSYEPLPDNWLTIKQYGTKVTFTVMEKVNMHKLVTYIKDISRFLRIPVTLDITDELKDMDEEDYMRNYMTHRKGITILGPVDFKDYLADKVEPTSPGLEFVEIDNEDYYFVGMLRKELHSSYNIRRLIGMPISISESLPFSGFTGWCLDIKNERKYMPTASRDSLTTEAVEKLYSRIISDLTNYFSNIHVHGVDDYRESDHKLLVRRAHRHNQWGFDDNTMEFSKMLTHKFEIVYNNGKVVQKDSFWNNVETFGTIIDMNVNIYYMRKVNEKCAELLGATDPNAIIIKPISNYKNECDASIYFLQLYGILSVAEYLKSNKIKTILDRNTEIILHRCGKRKKTKILKIADLNGNCIRVSAGERLHQIIDSLRDKSFDRLLFFKDRNGLVENNSVTLKEYCNKVRNSWYNTSDGKLTGRQILKKYKSGIVGLANNRSEFTKTLTMAKCKDLSGADIVIKYNKMNGAELSNIDKLKFVWSVEGVYDSPVDDDMKHEPFDVISDDYDNVIRDELTDKKLGIMVDGSWKNNTDEAVKHLSVIKNKNVRELYATAFSSLFSYGLGWKSNYKGDIKTVKTLHMMMVAIDKTSENASLSKICRNILDTGDDNLRYSGSSINGNDIKYINLRVRKKIADAAFEILLNICSDIEDVTERLNETLRIAMKDTVRGDITVTTDCGDVILTMDSQPITVDERSLPFMIVSNIKKWYYCYINSVSITPDGKMSIIISANRS